MRKGLLILFSLLLVLVVAAIVLVGRFTADVHLSEDVDLIIEEGSGATSIANQLEDAGLINNRYAFRLFAGSQDVDNQFKAGYYQFAAGNWSMAAICEALIAGGYTVGDSVRVTIREGLTVAQTAQILADAGLGDFDAYINYAENGDFSQYPFIPAVGVIPQPGNRLDGFLFPDTYMIDPEWTEEAIIDMLLEQFMYVWGSNGFDARADEFGIGIYEAVTMASIVEKEARVAEDRPIISGVFYNRLELGWKLETCASIQFILGEPKAQLTYADLAIDNPYNCYMYIGLPPGPIAAPGLSSLQAALYPEQTDYLYFRAREDGSHRFSKTLAEHEEPHEGDQQNVN